MRHLFLSAFLILTGALPVAAQPVVIELFASQNCRACPKAHETLKAASDADTELLVLTWSVDYWDYLGDADPMAMQESKDRQADYVERFGLRGPYTPQTVYNGLAQCPGNRPRAVRRNVEKAREMAMPTASISRSGSTLSISGAADAAGQLLLVEYLPDAAHETGMRHPVTRLSVLTAFEGGTLDIAVPACSTSCAVLLQTSDHGIPAALAL